MRTREMKAGINRCIKRLDAKIPKWRRLIDKNTLDIASIDDCITGQVFGSYHKGLDELEICEEYADYFGLIVSGDISGTYKEEENFNRLTQLWKEALS